MIPVTVISGYLGAGKTTLIKHILSHCSNIALLINEFGEVAVDGKIIGENVEMVELEGGCVCCSLVGEFEGAIKEILSLKPVRIVVETTGIADPKEVCDALEAMEGVYVDGVVVVVDGEALLEFPDMGITGKAQIACADLLLLNKIDLIKGREKEAEARLRSLSDAPIIKTVFCRAPLHVLFGLEHQSRPSPHHHETFASFTTPSKMSYAELLSFLKTLPSDVCRVKGIVETDKGRKLVNGVGKRLDLLDAEGEPTGLVVIRKEK